MRLIDADALKDDLCKPCDRSETGYTIEECRERGCGMMAVIDKQPTITADQKHGRWETVEDYDGDCIYRCNMCGEKWVLIAGKPKDNNMNYCPRCGARMDGGADNG